MANRPNLEQWMKMKNIKKQVPPSGSWYTKGGIQNVSGMSAQNNAHENIDTLINHNENKDYFELM